jgi:hypothetical protein
VITDKQKTKKERWKKKDNPAARSLISCPHCSSRKFAFLINKKESGKSAPEVLADKKRQCPRRLHEMQERVCSQAQ